MEGTRHLRYLRRRRDVAHRGRPEGEERAGQVPGTPRPARTVEPNRTTRRASRTPHSKEVLRVLRFALFSTLQAISRIRELDDGAVGIAQDDLLLFELVGDEPRLGAGEVTVQRCHCRVAGEA